MGGKGSGDKPKFTTETTAKKKEKFLKAFAEMGVVLHATKAAGVDRSTFYRWQQEDPDFAKAAEAALENATDLLEKEAFRRAAKGVSEPVFYQGEKVATVQKYSDTLLIFLLKGQRPDKYAERIKQDTTLKGGLTLTHLTDEELEKKLANLEGME